MNILEGKPWSLLNLISQKTKWSETSHVTWGKEFKRDFVSSGERKRNRLYGRLRKCLAREIDWVGSTGPSEQ